MQISLISALTENKWIFISSLAFKLLCCFSWSIWRKSGLTKIWNYVAFLDNYCECSLVVHQNLTWNYFLRVNWNVEFKMIWMNFLNSVTLELIGPPFTSNGSFIQTWFYQHHALAYWNAKILKMLTHLLYNMKEISHYVTTNFIKSLWQVVKLLVADKIFQNSNICLKPQIFFIGNKYCKLLSLKWQTHFVKFSQLYMLE